MVLSREFCELLKVLASVCLPVPFSFFRGFSDIMNIYHCWGVFQSVLELSRPNIKYEDDLKQEDILKYEDDLKNEGNLKNEENFENKDNQKKTTTQMKTT